MIVGVMTLSKVPQKTSIRAMRESCSFVVARNHASLIVSAALATLALSSLPVAAQTEFHEPVTLASKDGVLEVRLTARQGKAALDTVAKPLDNFLLFDYALIRGKASDGKK